MPELAPWHPRRVRRAQAARVLLVFALVVGGMAMVAWWLRPGLLTVADSLEQEQDDKDRVELASGPAVERRVANVDREVARVDADRTLRRRVMASGERQVFDDGTEIRKVRRNVSGGRGEPAAYVYYFDGGYPMMIRVVWDASAPPGQDEERFYFDPNALPPLIRWVGRDGRAAKAWSPRMADAHTYPIRYDASRIHEDAVQSRVCDRAPGSRDCQWLGFKPR